MNHCEEEPTGTYENEQEADRGDGSEAEAHDRVGSRRSHQSLLHLKQARWLPLLAGFCGGELDLPGGRHTRCKPYTLSASQDAEHAIGWRWIASLCAGIIGT